MSCGYSLCSGKQHLLTWHTKVSKGNKRTLVQGAAKVGFPPVQPISYRIISDFADAANGRKVPKPAPHTDISKRRALSGVTFGGSD